MIYCRVTSVPPTSDKHIYTCGTVQAQRVAKYQVSMIRTICHPTRLSAALCLMPEPALAGFG